MKSIGISSDDYKRAREVWNTFDMKILGDFHDLYLKTDVLLLCDVFQKFIKMCLAYYRLGPCHYFSAPGLSWDAMLKMTGIVLDHISDTDMRLFIEKSMVGGISYIVNRYAKANNKYMKDSDVGAEDKFIMHFDVYNLYRCAMSQCLPYGGFKWMTDAEINRFNIALVGEDSPLGYILEVDIKYPDELHDLHNDYALAPEKIKVSADMLSKYCSDIAKKYDIKIGEVNKVVPNLRNKTKYIVHYKNLPLYMSLGLKVTKVHRILKFSQSCWMKEYIDFNTEKRKCAANAFEKNFFKLMIKCVYGKIMENLRNRINVKLVNDVKNYLKWVSRPNFVSQKTFRENFAALHMKELILKLNKPIYVGFSALEIIKR